MDRGLLNKATTNDRNPTPGYMYNEIAKITHASPDDCEKLVTWLCARLKKSQPNIKYKCLVIIRMTSMKGSATFRRAFSAQTAPIKACQQFRGKPDPVYGEEPFKRVRDAAAAALTAIYNTPAPSAGGMGARMQGFGGNGGGGGGGGAVNTVQPGPPVSSGQMQGIGGTYQGAQKKKGILAGAWSAAAKGFQQGMSGVTPAAPSQVPNRSLPPGVQPTQQWSYASNRGDPRFQQPASGSYAGPQARPQLPVRPQQQAQQQQQQQQQQPRRRSGGVGGQWGAATTAGVPGALAWGAAGATSATSGGGAQQQQQQQQQSSQSSYAPATGGKAKSSGEYESQLVGELVAPGGMRPEPPRDKLARFLMMCKTLEPSIVCPLIIEALSEDETWQVQHKGLCVLEALAKDRDVKKRFRPFLKESDDAIDAIQDLYEGDQKKCKTKAAKVLRLLGEMDTGAAGAAPAAAAQPAAALAAAVDLFGDMAAPAVAPVAAAAAGASSGFGFLGGAAPAAAVAPAAAAGGMADMFGGMTMSAAAAPAPPSNAGGLLSEVGTADVMSAFSAPAAASSTMQPSFGDLFSMSASGQAPAEAQVKLGGTMAGGMLGGMGGMQQQQQQPPQMRAANGMLGGMGGMQQLQPQMRAANGMLGGMGGMQQQQPQQMGMGGMGMGMAPQQMQMQMQQQQQMMAMRQQQQMMMQQQQMGGMGGMQQMGGMLGGMGGMQQQPAQQMNLNLGGMGGMQQQQQPAPAAAPKKKADADPFASLSFM